jgi:hypothetical protein
MKKNYFIIAGITLLIAVFVVFFETRTEERVVAVATVDNDQYSLAFDYLSGEDGYELIESTTSDDFLQSYVLVDRVALADFRANEVETAPPTISIFVFQQPEETEAEADIGRITRLQNWAQANAGLTSFAEIYGTPDIIELDGVRALEYTTDGTYQQAIFLANYRGFIYMFVGQYDRPTDNIKADFETLMTTVRFE